MVANGMKPLTAEELGRLVFEMMFANTRVSMDPADYPVIGQAFIAEFEKRECVKKPLYDGDAGANLIEVPTRHDCLVIPLEAKE